MFGSWTAIFPGFASGNLFVVWYTCFALCPWSWAGMAPTSGAAMAMIIDRRSGR